MNIDIELVPAKRQGVFLLHDGWSWKLILKEGDGPEYFGARGWKSGWVQADHAARKAAREAYIEYHSRVAGINQTIRYTWDPDTV